jgi:hypothetical protein
MDLGTIQAKLLGGKYSDVSQLERDIELVWANCETYNENNPWLTRVADNAREKAGKLLAPYRNAAIINGERPWPSNAEYQKGDRVDVLWQHGPWQVWYQGTVVACESKQSGIRYQVDYPIDRTHDWHSRVGLMRPSKSAAPNFGFQRNQKILVKDETGSDRQATVLDLYWEVRSDKTESPMYRLRWCNTKKNNTVNISPEQLRARYVQDAPQRKRKVNAIAGDAEKAKRPATNSSPVIDAANVLVTLLRTSAF